MCTRDLVADDHPCVRQILCELVRTCPSVELVGDAADGEAAVKLSRDLRADLVLMDLRMPRLPGVAATRQILAADPHVKVIVISNDTHPYWVSESRAAGASGYLLKPHAGRELSAALAAVVVGGTYFGA